MVSGLFSWIPYGNYSSLLFIIIISFIIFQDGILYGLSKSEKKKIDYLIEKQKYPEARKILEDIISERPIEAEAHYKLGDIHYAMGETDKALQYYHRTISLDPLYYDAYYDIWKHQWDNAKDEKSKQNLKTQILEELDTFFRLHLKSDKLDCLGFFTYNMLKEKDKRDEMRRRFLQSRQCGTQDDLIQRVGQLAFENILEEQDRAKRVPLSEKYIEDFPAHAMTDIAYRIIIGYYWKDAPNPEKVKEYTFRWVKQNPKYPLALRISARVLSEMGIELDNAIKWADTALGLVRKTSRLSKPDWFYEWQCDNEVREFEALDTLGWAYFKKGDYKNAEKNLTRAVLQFDFDNRIWYHLANLYNQQSKPLDEIIKTYIQALICRDNLKELEVEVKNLYKRNYPDITDETLDVLYKNLYQSRRGGTKSEELSFFTDITEGAGLDKATGRRIAIGDYNNDGSEDILLNGSRLYHNNGNGTFTEVTKETNITGEWSGGVWADYNNDGWLDFFSSGWTDALWRNNGNGTFTNITAEINPKLSDGHPTEGAAWGDYDRDGFVDLYLANYENPFAVGTPDSLWKNIEGRIFEDITARVKITPPKNQCGRGVSWGDYNNDGWLDIFVSNYRLNPNFLWRNNRDGTFTNVAKEVGVEGVLVKGYYGHTIGSDLADFDNDGNLDLFQANLAHPRYITFSNMSFLLKNSGPPHYRFTEQRKGSCIRFEETHSDPAWADFDNDGRQDLYITSVYSERPSFLYKQVTSGSFRDVTYLTGTRVYDGWGCAWVDFDNDGDLDLVVSGSSRGQGKGNIYLFRNETISENNKPIDKNFLSVKLIGSNCNRAAIGARLTLTSGKNTYTREVKGGRGTTNQDTLVQHFGLGRWNEESLLTIRWPCGKKQQITVGRPNQIITVKEE
jgi:tetratricopeptide (TPR) repeat protein